MSKKDYIAIAKAIRLAPSNSDTARIAITIAKALKADNERFQFTKFMDAYGYPVE